MIDLALVDLAFVTFCARAESEFGGAVLAEDDLLCCQTCGVAEIQHLAEEQRKDEPNTRLVGYAFYHQQDTERARAGEDLYLSYGVLDDGSVTEEQVGHLLASCLRDAGFTVEWDGSAKTRVCVKAEMPAETPETAP